MDDPSDRLVQQVEVVADDEERAAVRAQEAEQPRLGVDIEVVGRLVEQERVGAGEEDAGQLDAAPLTTGEHPEREVEPVGAEPQARGESTRLALGLVAALHAELFLGARVAGDVPFARIFFHRDAQLLDPLPVLVDPATGQHVGHRRASVEHAGDAGVLREVAEAALAHDLAARGRVRAAEHPKQAGLAGTVAPDQTDLVLGHDGERRVLEQEAATHLDRESRHLQHVALR